MTSLAVVAVVVAGCGDDPVGTGSDLVPIEGVLTEPITFTLDPNGVTPLAGIATVRTERATKVTLRVLGAEPVEHEFVGSATEHELPVLGLRAGVENRVEIEVREADGTYGLDTLSIETAALPDFFPEVVTTVADREGMEPGLDLASFSLGDDGVFRSYPFMYDAAGEVRWYLDLSAFEGIVFMVERLANGSLVFGHDAAVYEYDMLGTELNRWEFPGYAFHHDVIEKPNGNLVVAVTKHGTGTVEDHVIELDRATGAIVREWDLREVLDTSRKAPFGGGVDWFHNNSVWYDERDDSLILSGRHQGIVKVSADNELVWILAPHAAWGPAGADGSGPDTRPFLLTAVDAAGTPYSAGVQDGSERAAGFDWPWAPHAAALLPNGNLIFFDNGDHRNFAPFPLFSRGVEYAIDEAAGTVRQVWTYGEARGEEYFSRIISDVDHLPETGNRLIVPGIVFGAEPRAYVTEVSVPGSEEVYEAEIRFRNARGTGEFVWGQFDMVYRAERLPLYPAAVP